MIVNAIKTKKVLPKQDLFELLDESLNALQEESVFVITSKIVGICEGRVVPEEARGNSDLVKTESDYFTDASLDESRLALTIKRSTLVPAAGIDASNSQGGLALWPADPQKSADEIWHYLRKRFDLKKVGLVITDSTIRPLHFGTEGSAIAYCGFRPVNTRVEPDLFGHNFKVTPNIADGLAVTGVLVMGEGAEQTPLATIEEVPFVEFLDHEPTTKELKEFYLSIDRDKLFGPILNSVNWQKNK